MSVRIRDLVKEYRDGEGRIARAVDGVSLEVEDGELITLLGPSGCGKTTTLRMIAGFEAPTGGEIWIGDKPMSACAPHDRDTPMVFQSYALFPHLSVRDNARFGLEMRRVSRREADRRVEVLAGAMGLSELLDRRPHELSGGQQQRVALLRALVVEPKVLLFDEPLSNLDSRLRVAMREEIRRIQKRSRITAIYVTHDQEEAMVLSDRIVVMERGRIAQVGRPREVYARPESAFVARFLGEANLIEASVVNGHLECALGRFAANAPCRDGSRVTLVLRPEALRLVPAVADGVRGTVRAASYLGAEIRYELAVGEVIVVARGPVRDGSFAEGDSVSFSVDESALHVLKGGG